MAWSVTQLKAIIPIWLQQMARAAVSGLLVMCLNITAMVVLVEKAGLDELVAAAVSTSTLLFLGFFLTDNWVFGEQTFSDETVAQTKRGATFYGIMITGKLFNYGLFAVLLQHGVWYPLSWFLAAVLVFFGTFALKRFLWVEKFAAVR